MLSGCGGLRYSQKAPESKNYHPKRIGVLPADVGSFEEARGLIDEIVAGRLVRKGWFSDVVAGETIQRQLSANEDLRKAVSDYMTKLKTVNFSDPELSRRIGDMVKADAFLILYVDFWDYTVEKEDKVAKVGLGIKMVDAPTGKIMWKAGHHETEDYMLFRPKLADVAATLVDKMLDEMPH
jgi:hypothetical protein